MAPSAYPTPVPVYAKLAGYYDTLAPFDWAMDAIDYAESIGSDDTWRRLEVRYKNTAVGATSADDAFTTFDISNITAGAWDSSWTTADFTAAEGKFDTFFGALIPYCPSYFTVAEYRWYTRKFTPLPTSPIVPPNRDKPFEDSGPPVRITSKAIIGTSSPNTLPQMAATITERTPWPGHWGRNYFPVSAGSVLGTTGRIASTVITTMLNAADTLHSTLATAGFQIVIPVTQFNKQPHRCVLQTSQLEMDDIADIIRRRRWRNPLIRNYKP